MLYMFIMSDPILEERFKLPYTSYGKKIDPEIERKIKAYINVLKEDVKPRVFITEQKKPIVPRFKKDTSENTYVQYDAVGRDVGRDVGRSREDDKNNNTDPPPAKYFIMCEIANTVIRNKMRSTKEPTVKKVNNLPKPKKIVSKKNI